MTKLKCQYFGQGWVPGGVGWWVVGGGFGPNILSLLVLIEIRIRLKLGCDKNKEDAQFIFKLRCQMTNLKANMKGKYETYVCRACKSEDENQKHVYQCKEIDVSLNEQEEYETLLEGTLKQKLKISEIMKKRIEKLQEIEQL